VYLDAAYGVALTPHLSLSLTTAMAVNHYQATEDYINWLGRGEYSAFKILFLWPFIPAGFFFDSQIFLGPTIKIHFLRHSPSPYLELGAGGGYNVSYADDRATEGLAFLGGLGMELREGAGVRLGVLANFGPGRSLSGVSGHLSLHGSAF
jgi:hypothetical protein